MVDGSRQLETTDALLVGQYKCAVKYRGELKSPPPRPPFSSMAVLSKPLTLLGLLGVAAAVWVNPATLDACPGYKATNVKSDGSTLTADLSLAGKACNVFGTDIQQLKLEVAYETGKIFLLRLPRIY